MLTDNAQDEDEDDEEDDDENENDGEDDNGTPDTAGTSNNNSDDAEEEMEVDDLSKTGVQSVQPGSLGNQACAGEKLKRERN